MGVACKRDKPSPSPRNSSTWWAAMTAHQLQSAPDDDGCREI
jgi:hypothetical protein